MKGLSMEFKDIWVAVGVVLGNMIGVGAIAKYIVTSVVKSNETLPVIAESVKTMTESIRELKAQNEELYDSRNRHDKQLERLETTHELNGCNLPPAERFHTHRRNTDGIEG